MISEREHHQEFDAMYPVWEKHTLWTRFLESVKRFPDNEYIVMEDCSLTYHQVKEQVNIVSRSLYAVGVRPGDHVAVILPNCPEFVFLTFAISKLGATKIPINSGITREELYYVLKKADAKFLISRHIIDDLFVCRCDQLQKLIIADNNKLFQSNSKTIHWPTFLSMAEMTDPETVEQLAMTNQDPDALADIMFTSGSTSRAKGVTLTHDMLLRSSFGSARTRCFELGRRIYLPCPLFHIYSYVDGMLALTYVGGTMIMSRIHFTVHHGLWMIRQFRANDMLVLGSMMIKMLTVGKPEAQDYPHLHYAYYGTSTPDWIWSETERAFGLDKVETGMGMTELTSCGVQSRHSTPLEFVRDYDGLPKDAGAAGLPELGGYILEYKVVDPETGVELPRGQEGEIYYRGITVTKGYYNDPEHTRDAFTEDGWLKSGDLGVVSPEGYLAFRSRLGDMYKVNGENVSPLFVDSVIGQCPLVTVVETVGVRHPQYGEVGVAFIEAADPSVETQKAIGDYCEKNLARFQIPKYYFYSDSSTWPRTATGKMSKKLLRQLAMELLSQHSSLVQTI